ncbi:MAG: hypothetical protein U0805_05825 [Pirellulales bacterium]
MLTLVALALGLSATLGSLVATLLLAFVYCIVPTPLVIGAVFARGDVQAFAIGALVPWWASNSWLPGTSSFSRPIWLVAMCAICGLIAVLTRRAIRCDGSRS